MGDDAASKVYVGQKQKRALSLGMEFQWITLSTDVPQEHLHQVILSLNEDTSVSGIIVQLPLPEHLDEQLVTEMISPEKDVDGFHPYNIGHIVEGHNELVPCTPKGIMYLLDAYGIDVEGKNVVIVGRSQIVGMPLSILMTHAHATVTVCHTRTKAMRKHLKEADIVVVAAGKPGLVQREDIKEGAVIIDVGINRLDNGKLAGDVDYDSVEDKVSAITPVPGGVGPMTVAMLMQQTIECACRQNNILVEEILGRD